MLQNMKTKKSIQTNSSPYDTVLHRPLKEPIKILQNTHTPHTQRIMFYEGISTHHGTTSFLFDIKREISSCTLYYFSAISKRDSPNLDKR